MSGLRPAGDGYLFDHDGATWTIRPAFPGGFELRTPGGTAVGWFDTPEDCVGHVTAPAACDACGHPARDGDPLITVRAGHDTAHIHRSHTADPQSGFRNAEEVAR